MRKLKIKFNAFTVIYLVGFLGAAVIGLLSNSYFAYDIFNSLWADILYLALIAMLFITAFVQEMLASRAVVDVIINTAIFILGLLFIILYAVWADIFILGMVILSAIMAIVLACRYALTMRKNPQSKKPTTDIKQLVAVLCLMLFPISQQLKIAYVNDTYMAWSLIPAAVATVAGAIIVTVLLRGVWAQLFDTKARRVFNAIGVGFIMLFVSYAYSFSTIGIINWVFDGEPQRIEYPVLDKKVRSGARTPTQFEVKIVIDGKEKWIPLPVTDYHEIKEGDLIVINYNGGALNFAYYSYYGKV